MQILASLIQAAAVALIFISLYKLGGVWIFALGGSSFLLLVGVIMERHSRNVSS